MADVVTLLSMGALLRQDSPCNPRASTGLSYTHKCGSQAFQKHSGQLKRFLSVLDRRKYPSKRVLVDLDLSCPVWTVKEILLKESCPSWNRHGLVFLTSDLASPAEAIWTAKTVPARFG